MPASTLQLEKRLAVVEKRLQSLIEHQEYHATIDGIREGLAQMDRGEGMPLKAAMARISKSTASRTRKRKR